MDDAAPALLEACNDWATDDMRRPAHAQLRAGPLLVLIFPHLARTSRPLFKHGNDI